MSVSLVRDKSERIERKFKTEESSLHRERLISMLCVPAPLYEYTALNNKITVVEFHVSSTTIILLFFNECALTLPTHMFWVRQEKTHLGGRAAKFEASKAPADAPPGTPVAGSTPGAAALFPGSEGAMVKSVKSPSSPL